MIKSPRSRGTPCSIAPDSCTGTMTGTTIFWFRENSLKPVGCLLSERAGQPFPQDEQMVLGRRELEEMLDILREAVFPKDLLGGLHGTPMWR